MSALDLKGLKKALKTLQPTQGPLARRNARTRVVDALRAVRQALDKEYPAPARKANPYRKVRTPLQRRKALIEEGFYMVKGHVLAKLAEAGVAVRTTPSHKDPSQASSGSYLGTGYIPPATWAPGWACYWYEHGGQSKVYEAKKSLAMIKAAKAAIRLSGFKPSTEDIQCPAR